MAQVRSNSRKEFSPVSAALRQLVSLMARQAAREWAEQRDKHASIASLRPEEKPR